MMALVIGMITMQSCKNTQFGIDYSLKATGDANGNVEFVFPKGDVVLDGTAKVAAGLHSEQTFAVAENAETYVLGEAVAAEDVKLAETANAVERWFEENFYVKASLDTTQAKGDYYVLIDGYARERVTGLTFTIHKEFTNRTTPPNAE